MNKFGGDFLYGRELLKKLIVGCTLTAIAALFFNGTVQIILLALTVMLFAAAITTMVRYCRCPHCDKIIFFGALAIRQCPQCKRDLLTGKKLKKSK